MCGQTSNYIRLTSSGCKLCFHVSLVNHIVWAYSIWLIWMVPSYRASRHGPKDKACQFSAFVREQAMSDSSLYLSQKLDPNQQTGSRGVQLEIKAAIVIWVCNTTFVHVFCAYSSYFITRAMGPWANLLVASTTCHHGHLSVRRTARL